MTFGRRRDTLDSGPGSGRCSLLLLCAGAVLETRLPHCCAQAQCWRALRAARGGHYGGPGSFCAQARDLRGGLFILVRRRNACDPPGKPMPEGQDVSGRLLAALGSHWPPKIPTCEPGRGTHWGVEKQIKKVSNTDPRGVPAKVQSLAKMDPETELKTKGMKRSFVIALRIKLDATSYLGVCRFACFQHVC